MLGCVALLALIAGTVSYLHMHMLVARHGQPGDGKVCYVRSSEATAQVAAALTP